MSFLAEPSLLDAGLTGTTVLKSLAATVALRRTGLNWKAAVGMGLGLAQLGEFSFLLIAAGMCEGVIRAEDYTWMLFIALGTLLLTPQFPFLAHDLVSTGLVVVRRFHPPLGRWRGGPAVGILTVTVHLSTGNRRG